jgi:cytochrome o ubiquinol oxidase subunit I
MLFADFLGKLSLDAIQHGPVILGAQLTLFAGAASVLGALFYFKRWTWLWKEWLTSLDPKKIGIMYIIVSVVMLLRGLADAGMMRLQQAISVGASNGFIDADHYQQVFTAHGTIMIFFVAMGLMFGLINLVLPLQLGARDVAFPFLNSVAFWLFVAGVILVNTSLVLGGFAATGWLAYPPLSEVAYSPGVGVDFWIWSLQISGIGSLLSGINFLVTILKMRCPGMTLMKMPIFAWSVLGSMILVIFAFPILTVTLTMLGLDRSLGMHFFTSDGGGNPMMYINLIWAWGHPEVYILVLPAFGIFSEVVATFSRKRLFGYTSMVVAIGAITFLSFIVWLHHFFTMGAGANVNTFFGIMTMIIAVPTGVKIFNWLFTMFRGRVSFTTPMLWFFGFVTTFTIGGVTGVLMSIPAADFQFHNSLFLVAHFHNMIIGGVVFGYFAGITYWFPKIFGFTLNERLGRYAFTGWLGGFLLAFIPLYILGFLGATRRLDHYDASLGWQGLFVVAGIGVLVVFAGVGFQILQLLVSYLQRNENRDRTGDPWDGRTLEWSIPSPAPVYNFAVTPKVSVRDEFWEAKQRNRKPEKVIYEDILLPKNSPYGLFIGIASFVIGFAIIWQIVWLGIIALAAVVTCVILRTSDDDSEYCIPASEVKKLDTARRHA